MKKLCVLGITGSIGVNVADIVKNNRDDFEIIGVSLNSNVDVLFGILKEHPSIKYVYIEKSELKNAILDKYPNVRKVLHDKEVNILSIDEIKALIEVLDIEDSNRMITEKEIFFSGGKEAYSYFKKTGII